jgi:hypothetical protein
MAYAFEQLEAAAGVGVGGLEGHGLAYDDVQAAPEHEDGAFEGACAAAIVEALKGAGIAYEGVRRHEHGVVGKLGANFACVEPHFHRLLVYGTEATFENGRDCAFLWRSREADAVPERIETPYPAVPKHALLPSFIDAIL